MSSMSHYGNGPLIEDGDYYADVNGYQVPQNIRHRFRSAMTADLLADKDKVERDKNEFEYVSTRREIPVYPRSQTTITEIDPNYKSISNDLRYTISYGHPVQRGSHSKTIHNGELFKNLNDNKQSDLYRRKKDWLARWTEANIIRDRLYKNSLEAQKKTKQ